MITKEKIIEKINRLSDVELEKVYLYLSSLSKEKTEKASIRSLKLNGKLDSKDIRSIAYE